MDFFPALELGMKYVMLICPNRAERDIMTKVDHPFVVGLKFSFQTDEKLFLVMDYLSGGELFFHLRKQVMLALIFQKDRPLRMQRIHDRD